MNGDIEFLNFLSKRKRNSKRKYFFNTSIIYKWAKLDARELRPPYKPLVKSISDLRNFGNVSEEDVPPQIPYTDPGTGWDSEF